MLKKTLVRQTLTKTTTKTNNKKVFHSSYLHLNKNYHQNKVINASVYEDLKNVNPELPFPWIEHSIPKRHEDQPYEIGSLSFNGLGSGKKPPNPIVFIHDSHTNSKVFSTIARKLNYPYGIVTLDLKARGKTKVNALNELIHSQKEKEQDFLNNNGANISTAQGGKNTLPLNLITHSLDFIRLLTYYGLPRAFIVGHGFGGFLAYTLMKRFPERISGAVLMNSGYPVSSSGTSLNDVKQLNERITESLALGTEKLFTENGVSLDNLDFRSFIEYTNKYQKEDDMKLAAINDLKSIENLNLNLDDLLRLRHPVALIRSEHGLKDGDKKPIIENKLFKNLENTLNTKVSLTVNGANHYNMLLKDEYAEQIANTIDKFVSMYDTHKTVEDRFIKVRDAGEDVKKEQ
ncbi:hypothetical protein ABK040_003972 [Willaertia magna]